MVKIIELLACCARREEIELLKYVLVVTMVLKKMQIFMKHRCSFLREKLYEQLLKSPVFSTDCQVTVINDDPYHNLL